MECEVCQFTDIPSWETLEAASRNGCHRCLLFVNCVKASLPTKHHAISGNVRALFAFFNWDILVFLRDSPTVSLRPLILDSSERLESDPLRQLKVLKPFPDDTSSEGSFSMIKSWINQCLVSHEVCALRTRWGAKRTDKFFPKRLLDLRDNMVVLREGLRPEKYACLSHCWGEKEHCAKTTQSRIQEFRNLIPWGTLPKTFQDAVEACRRLGVFHLWIDSLCILQDNSEDWEDQASKMADIFENAFITLAATKSRDSSEGLFATRSRKYTLVPVPHFQGIFVGERLPNLSSGWTESALPGAELPLLRRGWVYQEMRLSPRVIHFGSQEVLWECQFHRISQSGSHDIVFDNQEPDPECQLYQVGEYSALLPRHLWYRTVNEYSSLNLTYPKDKLPAIAALAHRMELMRVDDRYLAGLWEKTLLPDLLWRTDILLGQAGRPSAVRSPTWSWVSAVGMVSWPSANMTLLTSIHVKAIQYEALGPTNLGDSETAAITLTAPLFSANGLEREGDTALGKLDSALEEFVVSRIYVDKRITEDGPLIDSDKETYFIPMCSDLNGLITGLYVGRDKETPNFRRLGTVEFRHRDHSQDQIQNEIPDPDMKQKMLSISENLPVQDITLV